MHCRRHAHELFSAQLPDLETTPALLRAAAAIGMHELGNVDPGGIDQSLRAIGDEVRRRVRTPSPNALLAHLHAVMFDEMGFRGNAQDYYNPTNSYLPVVLEKRHGLPITLTLIYKCVAEHIGLTVHGVNAPWHFIAEVLIDGRPMYVDPFHRGRTLKRREVFEQIESITSEPVPKDDRALARATHRLWIARMLQNLINVFYRSGRAHDVAAMAELQSLLT